MADPTAPVETSNVPYVRFPTVFADTVVFSAADDLWSVPVMGGRAHRITAGTGPLLRPRFTPDGKRLVALGMEEGSREVYALDADGGSLTRLTYTGEVTSVAGFLPDGRVVYSSAGKSYGWGANLLYAVPLDGSGETEPVTWGAGDALLFGPDGQVVLGRYTSDDPALWKRYRGGTTGVLWLDRHGSGTFEKLPLKPNLGSPCFAGDRLYFIADHEGIGNLYSVDGDGKNLRRHSDHATYYARNASSDGRRVVYHHAGDLYRYDPATDVSEKVPVTFGARAAEESGSSPTPRATSRTARRIRLSLAFSP